MAFSRVRAGLYRDEVTQLNAGSASNVKSAVYEIAVKN
jgi:hypothetical protein